MILIFKVNVNLTLWFYCSKHSKPRKENSIRILPDICWEEVAEEILFHISFCWTCLPYGLDRDYRSNKLTYKPTRLDQNTSIVSYLPTVKRVKSWKSCSQCFRKFSNVDVTFEASSSVHCRTFSAEIIVVVS